MTLIVFVLGAFAGFLCAYVGYCTGEEEGYKTGYSDGFFERNHQQERISDVN